MDGVLADRAWVTGPLGESDALPLESTPPPLVCVRRIDGGWQVALVTRDLQTRAQFRAWIERSAPLDSSYERAVGAWWVSEWGMGQLTRGRHPFGLLLGDARRAITGGDRRWR